MNVLFFGPNGSGKGTQGAILKEKYKLPHIESGAIFRVNIKGGTELGMKAKEFYPAYRKMTVKTDGCLTGSRETKTRRSNWMKH
jgi:adenylate kinase family enzyme